MIRTASKGETGIQNAASADAADMIARANTKSSRLRILAPSSCNKAGHSIRQFSVLTGLLRRVCMWPKSTRVIRAASKGETGIQDAASADAADMIARAKAKAKQIEGPGISVLHEVTFTLPSFQTLSPL